MQHPQSVLIRSTSGWFEPRFMSAERHLVDHIGSLSTITWSRIVNDQIVQFKDSENVFEVKAGYGRGWRNAFHHLAFFFFILRRLHAIQPRLIYACDLDTLIPSLIWRLRKNCLIVYDQFDPFSSRTQRRLLRLLIDKFEYRLSKMSDVQITANKYRIPKNLRETWFEFKNLFPIEAPVNVARKDSPLILFYGGILSFDRGLLACAEAVSKEQGWEFHLYGQGKISKTLGSRNFTNVIIHQPIPHEELMSIASRSHLFLAMYDPLLPHNKFTASNKLFEAAQLGSPILTNHGTTIGSTTGAANLGWTVTYNDVEEIRQVLREVSKVNINNRNTFSRNLRLFYDSQKSENDAELDRIWIRVNSLLGGTV